MSGSIAPTSTDRLRAVTGPVDRHTPRSVARAYRGSPIPADPPSEPASTLLDLVAAPFESVEDVTDRLTELETRLEAAGDRRAVFLSIYVRMTRAVHEGLETGAFADPTWMASYLVAFADYYRRAFHAFERGATDAVPEPWRLAFGTAARDETLYLQDALLGVNAHINYDLALALSDIGIDPDRSAKLADHRSINRILADLVDVQQAALARLYAPGIADADDRLGRLDERVTLRAMIAGREQAWRIAVLLEDVGWPPAQRAATWLLRTTATGLAVGILQPSRDESLRAQLRRVEQDGLGGADIRREMDHRLAEEPIGPDAGDY